VTQDLGFSGLIQRNVIDLENKKKTWTKTKETVWGEDHTMETLVRCDRIKPVANSNQYIFLDVQKNRNRLR
jgi:hypothetical protein